MDKNKIRGRPNVRITFKLLELEPCPGGSQHGMFMSSGGLWHCLETYITAGSVGESWVIGIY